MGNKIAIYTYVIDMEQRNKNGVPKLWSVNSR